MTEKTYPLSHMQQGMLFHALSERAQGVDVEQIVATLREPVDLPALEHAWDRVVARHANLRLSFRWEGLDEPVQHVHRRIPDFFSLKDWSERTPAAQEEALADLCEEERSRGFDLASPPLLRVTLIRLGEADFRMIWTFPHILLDGRSFATVLKDLFTFYGAIREERPLRLDPPPPYSDYIDWLQKRDRTGDEIFWKKRLAGFSSPTPLPGRRAMGDSARAELNAGRGERSLKLPLHRSSALRRAAADVGVTVNTLVQGAWAIALGRHCGEEEVVFGATRACRRSAFAGEPYAPDPDLIAGVFINTLPVRVRIERSKPLRDWLLALREDQRAVRPFEHTPLVDVLRWSGVSSRTPLFESIIVFDRARLGTRLKEEGPEWEARDFRLLERTSYPLTLYGYEEPELLLTVAYDRPDFDDDAIERLLGHLRTLLIEMPQNLDTPPARIPMVGGRERRLLLETWNPPELDYPRDRTVADLFEEQVERTPDRVAVVCGPETLTYRELRGRLAEVAGRLVACGVQPETRVALCLERSVDMVVGLLAVLKAGGAYVPLDPEYPTERLAFMLADSDARVLLSDDRLPDRFPRFRGRVLEVRAGQPSNASASNGAAPPAGEPAAPLEPAVAGGAGLARPENLAYVIYTSGSTGRPKGVMVEHRNVVSFFSAMDALLHGPAKDGPGRDAPERDSPGKDGPGRDAPGRDIPGKDDPVRGCWLAATSISFDISVLELLWTLTRGYSVVIPEGHILDFASRSLSPESSSGDREAPRIHSAEAPAPGVRDRGFDSAASRSPARGRSPGMDFSLFYFAADAGETGPAADERYRLLLEGACFADRHGFSAVWTPERHFHEFGGLYPNPSVVGAALAAATERIDIRAGSVVLPLHDPIRVAEEWSVVDNLSGGRVGLSFASGWHDRDFVFAPDRFEDRRELMFREIEVVKALWRGESIRRRAGSGAEVDVSTLPRPVRKELPIWITAAGGRDTFRRAGEIGAGILTHLLGQSLEELAEKIVLYRKARRDHGHPGSGHVTLMLHAFVGRSMDEVRETVRQPFREYLRTSVDLIGKLAEGQGRDIRSASFSAGDMEALLDHAFERYFSTSSLMGTPEVCMETVRKVQAIGVDEIGCLIDFGVGHESVMESLKLISGMIPQARPARKAGETTAEPDSRSGTDAREAVRVGRHRVTHMQCTPSLATHLLSRSGGRRLLKSLDTLLIGGEVFPAALAAEPGGALPSRTVNMYGPTETTIWSSAEPLDGSPAPVAIGRPLANSELYILDEGLEPVPIGVEGDLYIGGDGVARGYLGTPELTARRFVPHPFRGESGARLYRTGDRARYRADGRVDFLGRGDRQVKVRGHRIEPGEIEAVLTRHPDIRNAVVTVSGEDLDRHLVAYVIPERKEPIRFEEVRESLRRFVPGAMVPTRFVTVSAFPLTVNGKIDREAMPAPDSASGEASAGDPAKGAEAPAETGPGPRSGTGARSALVGPGSSPPPPLGGPGTPTISGTPATPATSETPTEHRIAEIWKDVLQIEDVRPDGNFFDLGGHSLLTVRVHDRLRRWSGSEVTLTDLFRYPTVRALAAHIDGRSDSGGAREGAARGRARRRRASRRDLRSKKVIPDA